MKNIFLAQPDPTEVRNRTSGIGQVTVWFPVAIAAAVIAIESTPELGGDHTSGFLRPIFEWVFGRFQDQNWEELHHYIRKTGHFVGYGLVCLSFLRAWLLTLARRGGVSAWAWRLQSCIAAILSTATIASLDEWHQTYLPNRTGQVSDVLLDTCGATVLCLLIWLLFWRRARLH
jgi:VanZ family protein